MMPTGDQPGGDINTLYAAPSPHRFIVVPPHFLDGLLDGPEVRPVTARDPRDRAEVGPIEDLSSARDSSPGNGSSEVFEDGLV